MPGTEYPANVKQFMAWFKENGVSATVDYGDGVHSTKPINRFTLAALKANELGLKLMQEDKKIGGGVIIFDPKVPEQAFTIDALDDLERSNPTPLTKEQATQFSNTFKEVFALIADKDLSKADLDRIALLRQEMGKSGLGITLIQKDAECYIGLTMAGNAKYAHATLTKTASK